MNEQVQDFDIIYDTRVEYNVTAKVYTKMYTLLNKYSDIEMKFLRTYENVGYMYQILKNNNDISLLNPYILIKDYKIQNKEELKQYYRKVQSYYDIFQNYSEYILKTFNKHTRLEHIIRDIPLGYSFKDVYDKFHSFLTEIKNYIDEEKIIYKTLSGFDYEYMKEIIEKPNEKNDITTIYKELKYEIKTLCRIVALNYTVYSNYHKMIQTIFV